MNRKMWRQYRKGNYAAVRWLTERQRVRWQNWFYAGNPWV